MKERLYRRILLMLSLFVFACLLLSGGQRLVGGEEACPLPPLAPVFEGEAYLCNSSPVSIEFDKRYLLLDYTGCRNDHLMVSVQNRAQCRIVPGSDANGNVLGERSYMRAVYQAFALGDGFA